MMNVDMRLKEEATAAARKKAAKPKKHRKRKKDVDEEDGNGFHFIAYVPVCGQVWRMDGMEANPQSLGSLNIGIFELCRVLT